MNGNSLEFTIGELTCLIKEDEYGDWEAYVEVPEESPDFGLNFRDPDFSGYNVPGGVTFTGYADGIWCVGFESSDLQELYEGAEDLQRQMWKCYHF